MENKSKTTTLIISIFLGQFGIDRFYLGHTMLGIIKLLTAGGFGIWWLVDIILILSNKMMTKDGHPLV